MLPRIAAIAFIFVCTSAAWVVLGATIFERTRQSDAGARGRVASTWGAPHEQAAPGASYEEIAPRTEEVTENGKKEVTTTSVRVTRALPLTASRIEVDLDLAHRQKGLLWYSTYRVAFAGAYEFRNTSARDEEVRLHLKFPAAQAIYDDLQFHVNGRPEAVTSSDAGASALVRAAAGEVVRLRVSYRSQGLGSWRYQLGGKVAQVAGFELKMRTNFEDVDFPENTLSPTDKRRTPSGWELDWKYKSLISGLPIAMALPEKLQPGPIAGEISFFAPVSLFFFFFLMFVITTIRNIELHPMNYFFLATAFFSFHLLLAYLADHISIHAAFAVSSVVSVFLVVSYLRLVVGLRFAVREAAAAQIVYLVLFSYAFFFKGYTGLAITIGSILTLFLVMQMTGRTRWAERFAKLPAAALRSA